MLSIIVDTTYICINLHLFNMKLFIADKNKCSLFLAGLDIQEDLYKQNLTARIMEFLAANVTVTAGQVLDVAPYPRQYFSKARRFLTLSVQGNVDRDEKTGLFSVITPVLNGLFLDDEGRPYQPPTSDANRLPEGEYYFEQVSLLNDAKSVVTMLSENQLHLVNLPNS
jgi:hypothetical protein